MGELVRKVLSEAVLESFREVLGRGGGLSVSGLSICSYANYIAYNRLNPSPPREPVENIRMDDGHYQEDKVLIHLRRAGFTTYYTGKSQLKLKFGASGISGHPDGYIKVDGVVGMLEIKAMSLERFTNFNQGNLESSIKVQVQTYLLHQPTDFPEIPGVWIYTTHKDTCRPYDRFYPKDPDFIKPILEDVDKIILRAWEPPKVLNDHCSNCRHQEYCWGKTILDIYEPKIEVTHEMVDKWRKGKSYKSAGEELIEEARDYLIKHVGQNRVMIVEGEDASLKVQRIDSRRSGISLEKFTKVFGSDRLQDVWEEKPVTSFRIDEVRE